VAIENDGLITKTRFNQDGQDYTSKRAFE